MTANIVKAQTPYWEKDISALILGRNNENDRYIIERFLYSNTEDFEKCKKSVPYHFITTWIKQLKENE